MNIAFNNLIKYINQSLKLFHQQIVYISFLKHIYTINICILIKLARNAYGHWTATIK